eukprot:4744695-Ditylum_brightwellii.AAC.1
MENIRDSNEDQSQSNYTRFTGLTNLNSCGAEPKEQGGATEDQGHKEKNDTQEEETSGLTKVTILLSTSPGGTEGESVNRVTEESVEKGDETSARE